MCQNLERAERGLDRRTLLVGTGAAWAGLALSNALASPEAAMAHDAPPAGAAPGPASALLPAGGRRAARDAVLETVTGPVRSGQITFAVAHEHLFTDFKGATTAEYMDVDWAEVTGACANSARNLRAQGVDLFIDWTPIGIGRNVLMMRDVSKRTGMHIVCATGIYKSFFPPRFAQHDVADMADHLYRELTQGIDGTAIRAGWIKIASTTEGPTPAETLVHRAAARAAQRAGATISAHAPSLASLKAVVKTLEREGFDIHRFIWGHAQPVPVEEHKKLAARGAMIQYDAISGHGPDPFFHGPTDDESMLDRIQAMVEAGFGDRVLLATDASVAINPASFQYDRHNAYTYGVFLPKLRDRIGATATRAILRDNVLKAFRRGSNVRDLKVAA
jgi:phosphotriesterase-related protein